MRTKCRRCGAAVFWVRTENGKPMPLNWAPAEHGNVIIENGVGHVLHKGEDPGDASRFVPHFATCRRSG